MADKSEKIKRLGSDIELVINAVNKYAKSNQKSIDLVHPDYRDSALNLLHYVALRKRDLSRMQNRLNNLGLSRLARAERHVMPSLLNTHNILNTLAGRGNYSEFDPPELSIKKSKQKLKKHSKQLLNTRPKGRNSRIMVTMPSVAADDPGLITEMLQAGMNVARINCAHDSPDAWKRIIDNIRKASDLLSIPCMISMDLGGPKIRTGAIEKGPQIQKVRPRKNVRGKIGKAVRIWFGPDNHESASNYIPTNDFSKIGNNSFLYFRDTRNKKRSLKILSVTENGFWAAVKRTTFFETGMNLFLEKELIHPICTVGELLHKPGGIYLVPGSYLRLVKKSIIAAQYSMGSAVELNKPPEIHCTNSIVLDQVIEGDPVFFDDGKFGGMIMAKDKNGITIEINSVRLGGANLRSDKGINFPKSNLKVSGLTAKDRQDMKFVAKHADVVNMSFVNTAKDVHDLLSVIKKNGRLDTLGVILKIETQKGFNNLLEILLAGMRTHPIGVMIARGDLALEVGWKRIAIIQREIMKLCHAAHVPDIWATQVFENLAKTGVPSRAELTDVWVAQRSQCVMLNKGPYIVNAIELLDSILEKMDIYHDNDSSMLPSLKKASI